MQIATHSHIGCSETHSESEFQQRRAPGATPTDHLKAKRRIPKDTPFCYRSVSESRSKRAEGYGVL
jgi:hypothetical protein